ncbi:uncharacterized protein LOC130379648 isoform X3 [Gadus chalcogrammus]|nr:uncharacterized protein LOC130379648 isoform X3 [Gadus chalcogrammus]XP_056442603.1 uncharacterized protein LOC130379648 isoform X3 [Gadus chalcogrammus]
MPRPSRASSVAKMRMKKILPMATTLAKGFEPVHGTGARHCVKPWPVSPHTEKFNRLVLPLECPDKQFVLFVGDSHLRALADGYVKMPDGCLSFGFLSTLGASAAELRTELLNADIGRTPDIVCLLAPSNNLTTTPSIETAGVAFNRLLRAACSRWPKVFVLDFPPRLASELAPQQFLREEFRRVAAKNGVNYCLTADRFPLDSRALWSRDGIHLSDDLGMQVLAKLLWHFSYRQLEAASPLPVTPPPVVPPRSPPTVRSFTTTVVVKGEVSRPRPLDPFKETVVGRHGKRSQPENWDAPEDWDQSCMRILPHEVCVPPVVLKEYPVVLNPILFSTDTLAAIDRIVPSNLDSPMYATMVNHTKKRKVAHGTTAVEFSQLEGDDKSLCVDEWPFLQTEVCEKLKVNQPTAQVVSRQRQQEEPAAWGPKVLKAQADKPTANETSFLGCSTKMTHIEDHEQDEPAPEVTANSQQQSPSEVNGQLEDPHVTRGNQKAPCDVAPARAAKSSHVTYENPGCLKGSFDQSSHIFGENAGMQCATNSIAAIMTHATHSVLKWKKRNVHHVLKQGNGLYTSMIENNEISSANTSGYIYIAELPRHCKLNNKLFSLEYFDTLTGGLDRKDDYDASVQNIVMPLKEAIQKTLLQTDTCLLNIKENVCAVFKVKTAFAVFDPHSRSTWGSVAPDGTSIVAHYATVNELYDHIENLVNSLYQNDPHAPNKLFEVTGVKAVEVNSPFTALTAQPEASTSTHDGTFDTDSDSDLCVLSVTDRNSLSVNTSFSLETVQPVANTSKCDTTVNIDSDLPIHTDGASDVCLISVTDSPNIIFNGLTLREKNRICNKLNIVPSLDQKIVGQTFDMGQPEPCKTTSIEGDGNCFFRSLSSVISGCESYHKAFRKAVVNHISNNPLHYITEFASVEQYLRDSKMKYVGSWATVLEIQASADLLCVDIYTYSQQKWNTFTSNIEPILRKAIYLKHSNERHYEPIACVKEKTSLTCFSLTSFCEMSHKMSNADLVSPRKKGSDKVKNRRKRKRYAEDAEYRQFKKLKTQLRYYYDEQYQANQKASSIEKYANNEAFREQVKKSSIEKYAIMKRSKNK